MTEATQYLAAREVRSRDDVEVIQDHDMPGGKVFGKRVWLGR
jgi:hypothetical protein